MDHLTLKITPAKVVETSVDNKSPSQDSNHTEVLFQSRCTNNNHKHTQQLPTYLTLIVVNPIHRTYSIFSFCFLCQTVIREGTLVQINPWEVGTRQTKKSLHCKGNTSKFLQPNICCKIFLFFLSNLLKVLSRYRPTRPPCLILTVKKTKTKR